MLENVIVAIPSTLRVSPPPSGTATCPATETHMSTAELGTVLSFIASLPLRIRQHRRRPRRVRPVPASRQHLQLHRPRHRRQIHQLCQVLLVQAGYQHLALRQPRRRRQTPRPRHLHLRQHLRQHHWRPPRRPTQTRQLPAHHLQHLLQQRPRPQVRGRQIRRAAVPLVRRHRAAPHLQPPRQGRSRQSR